jgi:formate dehydrogenase major subunit
MTNSIREIEDAKVLLVIGSNTTEAHPVIGYYMKRAVRKGARLIVCDPRRIPLTRWAALHVQHRVGTDVALLNGLMNEILRNGWENRDFIQAHTENFEALREAVSQYPLETASAITGVPADLLRETARVLGTGGPVSLCYTLGITEHTCGTDNVLSCSNLQLLLGNLGKYAAGVNPLRGQNNVQGACDVGALPVFYPSYQRVDNPEVRLKFEAAWKRPGLSSRPGFMIPTMFEGMLDGRTRAFFCHGENVAMSEPNLGHVRKCLESLKFLAVAEIFENETTAFADVVFPCKSWAEAEGTFTNSERRVQRVRAAVTPPGQARDPWWIVGELGRRLGFDLGFTSPKGIFEEISSLGTIYRGITWERIDREGLQWPVPSQDHPGTPLLHKDGKFIRGKGLFVPAQWRPPAEVPDSEFPLMLTTGRRLWHYHTGTQTRNCRGFEELCGEELLEISPADARELGISDGQFVEVVSRRGRVRMKAWVTDRSPKGVVWSCFHFREACINEVTNNVFDPVSQTAEYKACAVRIDTGAPKGPSANRRGGYRAPD